MTQFILYKIFILYKTNVKLTNKSLCGPWLHYLLYFDTADDIIVDRRLLTCKQCTGQRYPYTTFTLYVRPKTSESCLFYYLLYCNYVTYSLCILYCYTIYITQFSLYLILLELIKYKNNTDNPLRFTLLIEYNIKILSREPISFI